MQFGVIQQHRKVHADLRAEFLAPSQQQLRPGVECPEAGVARGLPTKFIQAFGFSREKRLNPERVIVVEDCKDPGPADQRVSFANW